jgi:hypothetical protein
MQVAKHQGLSHIPILKGQRKNTNISELWPHGKLFSPELAEE